MSILFYGGIGPSSDERLETPLLTRETMLVVSSLEQVQMLQYQHDHIYNSLF